MLSYALLSLLSPLLPTGGFTWSQGLEMAVEDNLVKDEDSLGSWVRDTVERGLMLTELPLLIRFYNATKNDDIASFLRFSALSMAVRPTAELRLEEREKGRALLSILPSLGIEAPQFLGEFKNVASYLDTKNEVGSAKETSLTQLGITSTNVGYLALLGYAASKKKIELTDFLRAFVFAYTESSVMAGAKTIPLGQNAAWRIISSVVSDTERLHEVALSITDEEIGSGLVCFAIESARHETMYSRIYRN